MKHRVRSLLIILSMVFGLIMFDPMNCFSAVTFADEYGDIPEITIEIEEPTEIILYEEEDLAPVGYDESEYLTSVEDAAVIARQQLKNRADVFEIKFKMVLDSRDMRELFEDIIDTACIHTGNSDEGDYLTRAIMGFTGSYGGIHYSDYSSGEEVEIALLTLTYYMRYTTTAEQEQILKDRLKSVYSELGLSSKSDKEKIKAIHDYIINHVEYDEVSHDDLRFSAYAALINGTAVCNGYASLYYKMLLDNGIDNRVVTGKGETSSSAGSHGWNLVKLGSKYYYVDTTWDDGWGYKYYLFGSETYDNHIVDEKCLIEYAQRGYNISKTIYIESWDDCNGSHTWDDGVVTKAATCTGKGEIKYTCVKCDETKTEEIAPTGHKVVTDEAVAPTCTTTGLTEGSHCSVCGTVITPQDVIPAQGHKYGEWLQDEENPNGVYKECERCGKKEEEILPQKELVNRGFKDVVDPESFYYAPVYWAYSNNITTGTGNSAFNPTNKCTREQIVTFLWRMAGEPEPTEIADFTDMVEGAYYEKAVSWAYENGITIGLNDGTGRFGIGRPCTRAMAVTFLWRAAGKPEEKVVSSNKFSDVAKGSYYYKAVSWAAKYGITKGVNTKEFGIEQNCDRAMIVTFLYRYADISDWK